MKKIKSQKEKQSKEKSTKKKTLEDCGGCCGIEEQPNIIRLRTRVRDAAEAMACDLLVFNYVGNLVENPFLAVAVEKQGKTMFATYTLGEENADCAKIKFCNAIETTRYGTLKPTLKPMDCGAPLNEEHGDSVVVKINLRSLRFFMKNLMRRQYGAA